MFDVLCISDCCCDLIFKGLARVPAPGTEEYCQELYMKAGGGANTPMGLAKLGCATAYATALGDDAMGAQVHADLTEAGVAPDYFQQAPRTRTWVSAVLSTPGDRAFASFAGQGVSCTRAQLEQMVRDARWVHTYTYYCEKFPVLPQICREMGIPLSLDATFGEGKTLEDARALLGGATLFTPNDVEACALTGEQDPRAALEKLADVCPNVVVTMGSKGCIAALGDERLRALPPQVEAVDANGAGDLFNAGLLAARLAGRDAAGQLRLAVASGALAVTYAGGMDARYTREKVEALAAAVTVERL